MGNAESPYEVRCIGCDTSFPLGTRRCIHCGSRIASRRRPRLGTDPAVPPTVATEPGAAPHPEDFLELPGEEHEEEEAGAGGPLRIALWALSVGLALLGSMFRACEGG